MQLKLIGFILELIAINNNEFSITLSDYITSRSELSRKTERSRINIFEQWLDNNDVHHFTVNFADYVAYLRDDRQLQATTINAHLKSIRGRYRAFMKTNDYRNLLMQIAQDQSPSASPSDVLAMVNEIDQRLNNVIFADHFVREIIKQDKTDREAGIRLNERQISQLLESIDITKPHGIRDAALIALGICTGLREFELANIHMADIRETYEGQLALRVREGKGAKQRLIPYGTLNWCLLYVDGWLNYANIQSGHVFRGFVGRSTRKVRPHGISVRMINYIVEKYPVFVNGKLCNLTPHDLRRTYARLQFANGMSPEALQQNLGHESYDTTLGYIGDLDAEARQSRVQIVVPTAHLRQITQDQSSRT
jgi:site-specific recombinase XerD